MQPKNDVLWLKPRGSQDNGHYCNDTHERAVIEAEGSPMGPLIRAVNYIADHLAAEFPTVAVDTLCAYTTMNPHASFVFRC
jgi:hypothetical protein